MKRSADEADLLKPLPTTFTDDNDWPIFQLSNAQVVSPETNGLQNLLLANEANPLTVSGRLERLDRSEQHHLIDRDALPCPVSVYNVNRFSYGQYDSGEVALWAAGKAGWFEIKPSRPYKEVYKEMTEAIDMLYFAVDFFRALKAKKARTTAVDVVFGKYAEEPENKCPTEARARDRFLRHREVLLELMAQGKEGIAWKKTSIYKFLDRESSDSPAAQPETPKTTRPQASEDDSIPARLAGKGKSALRLRANSQSNKGAARQEALQAAAAADEEMDTQTSESRPSPPPKRKSTQDISDRPLKRASRRRQNEDAVTDYITLAQPTPSGSDPDDPPITLPLRAPNKAGRPLKSAKHPNVSVTLIETPLPSFAPNTPGDIWACPAPGCAHKIYAASTDPARAFISEHYQGHAHASQAAIDLVHKEERPYLPVGNLIKRIRELAARQAIPAVGAALDSVGAAGGGLGGGGGGRTLSMGRKDSSSWMVNKETMPKAIRQRY